MQRASATSKPMKMWIDGKCFDIRKFQKRPERAVKNEVSSMEAEVKFEINTTEEGKWFTSLRLPQIYHTKLSNFSDWDMKTLAKDTNTNISIPTDGQLVITGETKAGVTEAREEIHSVVAAIRDSISALQFVSIPIRSDEITRNFNTFKQEILSGARIDGMDESIFQNPLKLHLTVVVFALLDEREKSEAVKVLLDYKSSILDPLIQKSGPIKIRVSGIDCMNQNLRKVDVLYANAKIVGESEDFNLQGLVNDLSNHFYDRGLVRTYKDIVKLHMTLINTKYRKVINSPKKTRWVKRQSFDATTVIKKYKDFTFGECNLSSIHLSLMSTIGDDGFYKPMAFINVE